MHFNKSIEMASKHKENILNKRMLWNKYWNLKILLHVAETWAMKADTLNRLRRNDCAMIRWICNVNAKDEVSSDSLLTKLGIQDLDVVLRTGRMRWFGHVERSTDWISEVRKLNVVAQKRSGRPRKS